MRYLTILFATMIAFGSTSASAQLNPFEDYEIGEAVWSVSTVRVNPNQDDDYLEGLKLTWVATNEIAKELGQVEDFGILRSVTPQGGDFNLLLWIKYPSSRALDPDREAYDAFMAKWGEEMQGKSAEIVKDYPSMRKVTGEYNMREITIK